jgi:RNA polymerase sigma factor (sigma-70 family)
VILASIPQPPPRADLPSLDDDALVAAWKAGDDDAFSELVERHGPPLLGFLRRHLGDPGLADDAWSETFLRLIRARDRYKSEGRFRAWLYTVARRCAKDQRRGRRRWVRLAVRVFDRPGPRADEHTPDLRLIADEQTTRLEQALGQLSEEHRTVVLLTYRQGLDSGEVGEVMGLTGQQVRSRLTYARRLLGRLLGDEGGEVSSPDGARDEDGGL